MGRLSFEGIRKRKSMFMPLGVVVSCLSSRLSRGKRLLLLSLLSTSKEGGQKQGASVSLITSSKLAMGTSEVLGQEIGLMIWDGWHQFICCPNLKISPPVLPFYDVMVRSN